MTSEKLLDDMRKLQVIVVRQEQQTKSLKMENSKLEVGKANLKARLRLPKCINQTLKQKRGVSVTLEKKIQATEEAKYEGVKVCLPSHPAKLAIVCVKVNLCMCA